MLKIPFYITDVFARGRYSGNQLAVLRCGGSLSGEEMQRIAREINFSETAFILSEEIKGYGVRIFTPASEVPFAGHPVLGTAHVIRTEIRGAAEGPILLHLAAGMISVDCDEASSETTRYWMKQLAPKFGRRFDRKELAPLLGISAGDIDERYPVEEVSTGLPHIIVPLVNDAVLSGIALRMPEYWRFMEVWKGPILVFSPHKDMGEQKVRVRMFAPCLGVPEDPATGSGNGCLAGYLVRHRFFGCSRIEIMSEQGDEIGRPSLLFLKAEEKTDGIEVLVGGTAITVARGEFLADGN